MPTPLQKRAVQIGHEGHQGIALIWEKVLFPIIDRLVQDEIGKFLTFKAIGREIHHGCYVLDFVHVSS